MNVRSTGQQHLIIAAAAGLALGATACKGKSDDAAMNPIASATAVAPSDKACCKGKNACKGKGGCDVPSKHDCAGKNDCKGQGGCNMQCPK